MVSDMATVEMVGLASGFQEWRRQGRDGRVSKWVSDMVVAEDGGGGGGRRQRRRSVRHRGDSRGRRE
jgi:hypothetical protein